MKLKIVSGGMGYNTHVIDEDTGQKLENVSYVSWSIHGHRSAEATIRITKVSVDLQVDTGVHIIDDRS